MPQMMPLNWISLMFQFMMIFLMFNILIYFNLNKKFLYPKFKFSNTINWKL